MSDQTIPPCPVCGNQPTINANGIPTCCENGVFLYSNPLADAWTEHCHRLLGRACRELGIETVEQLKGRLAPDKDYTFLLSIIHWAITFWDAVPNDTVMHYTPLPKGIDLDYLRDLVKGVKYPPKLADDSPVAPDPRVAVLDKLEIKTDDDVEALFVQAVMGLRYSHYYTNKMSKRDLKMLLIDRKFDATIDALPLDTMDAQSVEG